MLPEVIFFGFLPKERLLIMKWHGTLILAGITCVTLGCVNSLQGLKAPEKPWEGQSRTFEATPSEVYLVTKDVLAELNITPEQENQDQGLILAKVRTDQRATGQADFAGFKKLIPGTILVRIDIKPATGNETLLSIVAKRESLHIPETDADSVGREIMDGLWTRMSKITEQRAQVAKATGKQHAQATEEVDIPSDVDRVPSRKVKQKPNAYAVLVGIESYRDLPRVDYAQRDAAMMKEYLVKILGYQEEHVILRTNERATRGDIEAYFENWLRNNVDKDSEVFVYYAGHGSPDPKSGKAFLVPYDGNPAFLETTAYPLDRLYKSLSVLPTSHIIVALDSCFSGAGGRSVIAKGTRPMMLTVENPVMAAKNITVLAAAQGNQISSAYPEKRHGLFTYFFLKGLMGEADSNKDGQIELNEVFTYLKPQVERQARRANQEQTPQMTSSVEALGNKNNPVLVEMK